MLVITMDMCGSLNTGDFDECHFVVGVEPGAVEPDGLGESGECQLVEPASSARSKLEDARSPDRPSCCGPASWAG